MLRTIIPLVLTACLAGAAALAAPDADRAQTQADTTNTLAQICAQIACRKTAHAFSLRSANGADAIQAQTRPFPYLDPDGTLLIFPGETIALSVPVNGTSLGKPRLLHADGPDGAVNAAPSGDATLTFMFRQRADKPDMDLIVTSTVPLPIKYDAEMQIPGKDGGMVSRHTSICPLLPPQGISQSFSGFENWPQPVVMLVIHGLHALAADGPRNCS